MQSAPSSVKTISVAARGSPLSRAQCAEALLELRQYVPDVDFLPTWVETTGDKDLHTSLRTLDKTDFFTKEVDALVQSGTCRLSIHSAKDLPEPLADGLVLVALTRGVDPSDALVFREGESLQTLPLGAKVGVSSERREKTIYALRPDLRCVDIRGNIGRRLELLDSGCVDALVMASAALLRLHLLRSALSLPGPTAPLQGRLAILARKEDTEMQHLFSPLHVP